MGPGFSRNEQSWPYSGYARKMILFPELLDLPRRLRHPEVRDLAWAILAPPMLIDTPWPQRHPLTGSDWVQQPHRLEHWLQQLDRDSYPLLHCLSQGRTRRLGLYYERLWQFAVQHAPGIELVAWEDREVIHVGAPTLCEDGVLAAAARALMDPRVRLPED